MKEWLAEPELGARSTLWLIGPPALFVLRRGSLRFPLTPSEGWCQRRELNPRPKAYESSALPLSYSGNRKRHHILRTIRRLSIRTDIQRHFSSIARHSGACFNKSDPRKQPAIPDQTVRIKNENFKTAMDFLASADRGHRWGRGHQKLARAARRRLPRDDARNALARRDRRANGISLPAVHRAAWKLDGLRLPFRPVAARVAAHRGK